MQGRSVLQETRGSGRWSQERGTEGGARVPCGGQRTLGWEVPERGLWVELRLRLREARKPRGRQERLPVPLEPFVA